MATARQKNGKWYYRITISSNGERRYIERGGYRTKKEALDVGIQVEAKLKRGVPDFKPVSMTYKDLAKEWLSTYGPSVYKQTTLYSHEKELRTNILPVIADYDINAITRQTLQDLLNKIIFTGHTRNRLLRTRATLSKSFEYAIMSGYMTKSPVEGLKMPLERSKMALMCKPPRKQQTCSRELICAIFDRFPEGHPCFIPLLLGYRCGMRLGESYGLLIEDVDLSNRVIHVRRQLQFDETNNKLYFTAPKYCKPGFGRDISLDSDTCDILRRHINKLLQLNNVLQYPVYHIDDYGYISDTGELIHPINIRPEGGSIITPRTMQHVSRVIHGKEGVFECPNVEWDFHMLRHTHASECIAAGMSPVSVSERLGHKRLETTYRYYVHETEGQNDESKRILERMFA